MNINFLYRKARPSAFPHKAGRTACYLLPCLLLISGLAAHSPASPVGNLPEGSDFMVDSGEFSVIDERASDEISETSRLYLNGHLAATFHLGLNHDHEEASLTLPSGAQDVSYTLCGVITITHHGHAETHQVSSEGWLHHPDGHRFEAVGTDHFSDFFLVDYDDPDAADHQVGQSAFCTAPNS